MHEIVQRTEIRILIRGFVVVQHAFEGELEIAHRRDNRPVLCRSLLEPLVTVALSVFLATIRFDQLLIQCVDDFLVKRRPITKLLEGLSQDAVGDIGLFVKQYIYLDVGGVLNANVYSLSRCPVAHTELSTRAEYRARMGRSVTLV